MLAKFQDPRKPTEVFVQILARLLTGNTERGSKRARAHPVKNSKIYCFGSSTLFGRYVLGRLMKYFRGCAHVYILIVGKRLAKRLVSRKLCGDPKLEL